MSKKFNIWTPDVPALSRNESQGM